MSVSASVSTDISLIQPCGPPEIPCSMSITSLFLTGFFRTAPRNRLTFLHKTSGTAAPEKKFPASRESATSGGAYSRSWLAGSAGAAMRVVGSPVRCTSRSWSGPSAPKVGNGSRSRPMSPAATPPACAG